MPFGGDLILQLLICAEFELAISCVTGKRIKPLCYTVNKTILPDRAGQCDI